MTECSFYNSGFCSSCELIKLPYPEQLIKKRVTIQRYLGAEIPVFPCIGSDILFDSRYKAKMAVGGTQDTPTLGFVKSDYSVSDITDCPLHSDPIRPILNRIKELVVQLGIAPYDIASKSGELKFIIIRVGNRTRQTVVRFVVRSESQRKQFTEIAKILEAEFDEIELVSLNLQPIHQAVLEGETEIILSSRDFALEELSGFLFAFSPESFGQVTPSVAEKLYAYVAKFLDQSRTETLLDLYCGVGAFSIFSHKSIGAGVGVELSESAVKNAKQSAQLNSVKNIEFLSYDVEKYLEQTKLKFDVAIANPPRRGLAEKICRQIMRHGPQTIIYSSCNPETLARDIGFLSERYQIESVQPFDMFPLTSHVEVLTIMHLR